MPPLPPEDKTEDKKPDISRHKLIPSSPSEEFYRIDEDQGNVFTHENPITLFEEWLGLARAHEVNDPNAMSLATIDRNGMPDVRVVLLKDIDERGLSFYTNVESAKGRALAANPVAALCFHWKSIRRQVRFRGKVESVSHEEADAYFATRARGAQIGAWASAQSRPLSTHSQLESDITACEERFTDKEVERPNHWSGFRIIPTQIEFWVNKPFRLHERLQFERTPTTKNWTTTRLYP